MLNLTQILRASHVRRWNIVATSRDQSVAEHTFNVVMIARALCKAMDINDEAIIKAALEHDLDEIIYGDIPSPMKKDLMGKGVDINEYVGNRMRKLSGIQTNVLKVADLLDAALFLRDHRVGNHGEAVLMDVTDRLIKYVEKEFVPGFPNRKIVQKFVEDVLDERI